jgi:hypothetical protein
VVFDVDVVLDVDELAGFTRDAPLIDVGSSGCVRRPS